jgi:hypothetical protein
MIDNRMVASRRFELRSQDPESRMIDHYTTRLSDSLIAKYFIMFFVEKECRPKPAKKFTGWPS